MAISQGRWKVEDLDKDGMGGLGHTVVMFELFNHKGEAVAWPDMVLTNAEAEEFVIHSSYEEGENE